MIELLLLAVALSMDACAVSMGLGAREKRAPIALALQVGIYFGGFQALMPLIGYFGGRSLLGWLEGYTHWVAFVLLALIGGKMLYDSFTLEEEADAPPLTPRLLLLLAIATSIDAMAAGFTLNLLAVHPLWACAVIGLTTALLSALGVWIGVQSGTWLESQAERLGGVVLILMGLKFLLV